MANLSSGRPKKIYEETGHRCPVSQTPLSNREAAELSGVSERTVKHAKKVDRDGTTELKQAMHEGRKSRRGKYCSAPHILLVIYSTDDLMPKFESFLHIAAHLARLVWYLLLIFGRLDD